MNDTPIIVIDGSRILRSLDLEYQRKCSEWHAQCQAVHARYKKKTSRTVKNGKEYESTNWYVENGNGGLKSVGKVEPDYKKYYPPEPKRSFSFSFREYAGDVLIEQKDYNSNQAIFRNCLAFPIEACLNLNHPLYKNPLSVPLSVRNEPYISVEEAGQKKRTGNRNFDLPDECRINGGGDCENCQHEDCPDWVSVLGRGVSSARSSGEPGQNHDVKTGLMRCDFLPDDETDDQDELEDQ